jgi:hypothetical protein
MVSLYRPVWVTGSGGTGYSVFAHEDELTPSAQQTWANAVRTFLNAITPLMPNDVSISFPAETVQVNTSTGTLIGVTAVTAPASITGASAAAYAAPSGARVDWITAGIVNGRRVRGRTYLVPLISTAYDTDGTINSTNLATISTAAASYITNATIGSADPVVWSRPLIVDDALERAGSSHVITGRLAVDKAAILRGRRD